MSPPLIYDGSYAGFLSAVFEAYRQKLTSPAIVAHSHRPALFADGIPVETVEAHAERVASGIEHRAGSETIDRIYRAFLSDERGRERILFEHIAAIIRYGAAAANNVLFEHVLAVAKMAKRTGKEVHRMHAFVRFEEAADGTFVSTIAPDCDVIPLIGHHFKLRYPVMHWAIYDERRGYGIYYDTESIRWMEGVEHLHADAEMEPRFQELWKAYFRAVNIPERRNARLHLQHVPRRYWRYLTEKRP
jgi:probable DNA metabolism protein